MRVLLEENMGHFTLLNIYLVKSNQIFYFWLCSYWKTNSDSFGRCYVFNGQSHWYKNVYKQKA